MMQWRALFRKEVLENWRNYKWIWVPLVITLLAIMDPITTYYMPQIIDSVGGGPEGATLDIPTPLPNEAIMMSLSQLSGLGVLVILLMSMGSISSERKSGITELILVKPIAYRNYITAKWFALILITWLSLSIGLLTNWYYVNILFGDLALSTVLQVILFYGLWLTLVISISIFYNTIFRSPGLVVAFSIMTIGAMSIVTTIFSQVLMWSPNKLSTHIQNLLITDKLSIDLMGSAITTIVMSVLLLVAATYILRTKEFAE